MASLEGVSSNLLANRLDFGTEFAVNKKSLFVCGGPIGQVNEHSQHLNSGWFLVGNEGMRYPMESLKGYT